MTNKDFSDAFDTLVSAYSHKSEFGDLSSYADVTLDEYEKSVFLTQALDNIVKSYFSNRSNATGEGFDDSIRRQADFSSLITVHTCKRHTGDSTVWNTSKKALGNMTQVFTGDGSYYDKVVIEFNLVDDLENVLREVKHGVFYIKLQFNTLSTYSSFYTQNRTAISSALEKAFGSPYSFSNTDSSAKLYMPVFASNANMEDADKWSIQTYIVGDNEAYDARGVIYDLPSGKDVDNYRVLLMLNERVETTDNLKLVVVPISYQEYDRMMSRAYAQPLKKQAWRLFEGDKDTTTRAEIIAKEGLEVSKYKIRYIRRPRPIILTDLDLVNSLTPLEIDGESKATECELNPILHMDILEHAVLLALGSKGIETRETKAARELALRRQQ